MDRTTEKMLEAIYLCFGINSPGTIDTRRDEGECLGRVRVSSAAEVFRISRIASPYRPVGVFLVPDSIDAEIRVIGPGMPDELRRERGLFTLSPPLSVERFNAIVAEHMPPLPVAEMLIPVTDDDHRRELEEIALAGAGPELSEEETLRLVAELKKQESQ